MSPSDARRFGRAGLTLVEVVIGMLLVALLIGAMMSIALTGKIGVKKSEKRAVAAMAGGRLLDQLKRYVTADPAASPGPSPGHAPNGWGLPGDSCGCYALAAGRHELSADEWLPELAASGGTISYEVRVTATASGPAPTVSLKIDWNDE